MAKTIPSLGELELQVLRLVWREQPCTERRVTELVQAERPVARTTVLKTMQRLEEKGLLVRDDGPGHGPIQYRASVEERSVLPALIRRFVERVLGGSNRSAWRRIWPTPIASGSRRRTWKPSARSHARSASPEDGRVNHDSVIKTLNGLAGAWAGLAWAVTWQLTVLVGVFALVAWWMRRSSPSMRYWLWQIAAIKLLVMPMWGVSIMLPATPHRDSDARSDSWLPARIGGRDRLAVRMDWRRRARPGRDTPTAARARCKKRRLWIKFGRLACLAFPGLGARGHRPGRGGCTPATTAWTELLRRAAPAADPTLLALVTELSSRIGLRRQPRMMTTDGDGSPFVCGLRRPTLVLTRGLASSIDTEALRSVLLHELAHIKRGDLAVGLDPDNRSLSLFLSSRRPITSSIAPAWSAS